ncbi:MAG: MBL fold metallo-hydrolase [Chitinophagales bacterium]
MIINSELFKTVDEVRTLVVIDNSFDGLMFPGPKVARRGGMFGDDAGTTADKPSLVGEHGYSLYIEWLIGEEKHAIMMDFGGSEAAAAHNAEVLGLDLTKIDAMVLSHGHLDHFRGVSRLADMAMQGRPELPFYTGVEAFAHRYFSIPGRAPIDLLQLSPNMVTDKGLSIQEVTDSIAILPGLLLLANVPRVTDFELGQPFLEIERNGALEKDTFPGELSLVFNLANKGLVLITACSHAGFVNIMQEACKVTGEDRVYAILGGFHLTGAPPEKIEKTLQAITAKHPDVLVPMHCTGFPAIKAMSDQLSEAFIPNTAGSEYIMKCS